MDVLDILKLIEAEIRYLEELRRKEPMNEDAKLYFLGKMSTLRDLEYKIRQSWGEVE